MRCAAEPAPAASSQPQLSRSCGMPQSLAKLIVELGQVRRHIAAMQCLCKPNAPAGSSQAPHELCFPPVAANNRHPSSQTSPQAPCMENSSL